MDGGTGSAEQFEPGVRVEMTGPVARLWLDRPPLNLLSTPVLEAGRRAVAFIARQPALRAVVVSGAGSRAFCGGVDVTEMAGFDPDSARAFITLLHAFMADLQRLPVPVIARIDGHAAGGGCELAVACDLRVASDNAAFAMPEVLVGIPSVIEAALIPRLVGDARAAAFLLTGEPVSAATALSWGLVNEVVPAAELDAATDALVTKLLRAAPAALAAQKWLLQQWREGSYSHGVALSIDAFANAYRTGEPREGMTAFKAKRPAGWVPPTSS